MKDTIIISAPNFGFGPASHALTIARAVRQKANVRLLAVTDSPCAPYLEASSAFDAVIQAGPNKLPELSILQEHQASVVVAVTDFDRAAAAKAAGFAVLVVDALYWMWRTDPIDVRSVDGYLCLAFPGVAARIAQIAPPCISVREIPQISEAVSLGDPVERDGVILNFGGGSTPFGLSYAYAAVVVECVQEALAKLGSDGLLIACSELCKSQLQRYGVRANIRCLTLNDMLKELQSRSVLITLPGLSIMWEAVRTKIPTLVLPGINYSQHQQVREYRKIIQGAYFTWDDLPGYGLLSPGLDEDAGIKAATDLGNRFARDSNSTGLLTDWLVTNLAEGPLPPALPTHHAWNDLSGAEVVANEIMQILALRAG